MINKIYIKHIFYIFLTRFINLTLIFSALIFIMNILEELKFFGNNNQVGIGYPVLLTTLNLPSVLFEIFPFIILISTQFFFIKFQNTDELLIFKNNGINNLKIISFICLLVFVLGLILITIFHLFSSSMKNNYLEFKNKYTNDNKYLAVINENGLWIKDKINDKFMIIHAEKIEKNILKKLLITEYDSDYIIQRNIVANEAIINSNKWNIKGATIIDDNGKREKNVEINVETNFDYIKINSLFSNLESLNIIELINQKNDFKGVGLNVSDIDLHLYKLIFLPISLVIFTIMSSILMLNIKFKKSPTFMLIVGILLSVIIYYIFYFFELLGSNNKIPIILSVLLPNLILFLTCLIGIVNINEK